MSCGQVFTWNPWSSGPNETRGFNAAFIAEGWPYLFNGSPSPATKMENIGPSQIAFHLPFGHHASGDFDMAAFTECQADATYALIANQTMFVSGMVALMRQTEAERVWFYSGYAGAQTGIWDPLTTPQKTSLIQANLDPFIAVKSALISAGLGDAVSPVGVAIDTLGARPGSPSGDINWTIAVPYLDTNGILVGGEPWPALTNPRLSDANYYTFVAQHDIDQFDPAQNPGATWAADLDDITGPIVPFIVGPGYSETDAETLARAVSALSTYDYVAIEYFETYISNADSLRIEAGDLCMNWTPLITNLRYIINDLTTPQTWTNSQLTYFLAIASTMVFNDLNKFIAQIGGPYVVDLSEDPPTVDPSFLGEPFLEALVLLKAACIITNAEYKKTSISGGGIKIVDDKSQIDTTKSLDGLAASAKSFCGQYTDAINDVIANGLGSADAIARFILAPYSDGSLIPLGWGNNGMVGR